MGTPEQDLDVEPLPREPIHKLIEPLNRFLHVEAASGIVLVVCAVLALALANSPVSKEFLNFWTTPIGISFADFKFEHTLKHWINDGLMVIFFFVIGLEVKRELVLGELKEFRRLALPFAAALGGMAVPAGVYLALLSGKEGQQGSDYYPHLRAVLALITAFYFGCIYL